MVSLEREQQPSITTKEATQTVVVRASLWPQTWTDGRLVKRMEGKIGVAEVNGCEFIRHIQIRLCFVGVAVITII